MEGGLQGADPSAPLDLALDERMVDAQGDELLIIPGPVGGGGGKVGDGLQKIGLSLGVLPADDVDPG